ncbi:hypothetical protein A9Q83_05235 [Alphaproteobacteria bacterium 46_93_T64]|nr:hypothetical protein A9Q83_05235 [Alphaproteobacteria bacterium 46_93_T64]
MHDFFERILIGRSTRQTLSKYAKGIDRWLGVVTLISAALLGTAIAMPLGASDDFLGLEGSLSLFLSLVALVKTGEGTFALAGSALFIALPIYNISTAFDIWYKHEIHGEKFDKYVTRVGACGRLWFLLAIGSVGLIYLIQTSENGTVYLPVYYLLLSIMLQKLVLTRLGRLTSAVRFVDEIE